MDYEEQFCSPDLVFNQIKNALSKGHGFSLIRIGDGETRVMAHYDLIAKEEIPSWVRYAGVVLPNLAVKKRLLEVVREADVVGLPIEKHKHFKPLMLKLISKYKLAFKNVCSNRINYALWNAQHIHSLIKDQKIIIVGREALKSEEYFKKIAQSVKTYDLDGIDSLRSTVNKISLDLDFSIALVSAGIPAKILCVRLAKWHKIALDFGHVIDSITNPGKDLFKIMREWSIVHKVPPP